MGSNKDNENIQESKLKDIIREQLENEEQVIEVKPEKKKFRKLNELLSKEQVMMDVKKKTRSAEIMGIFARHNFYAAVLLPRNCAQHWRIWVPPM